MNYWLRLKERLVGAVRAIELVLTLFIIAGVLLGSLDLVNYLKLLSVSSFAAAYGVFKDFLGHLLLLIIGLELIIMLVKHTPESILEVLTITVARKVLIYSETFLELLLGIIALAAIFVIKKYLYSDPLSSRTDSSLWHYISANAHNILFYFARRANIRSNSGCCLARRSFIKGVQVVVLSFYRQ